MSNFEEKGNILYGSLWFPEIGEEFGVEMITHNLHILLQDNEYSKVHQFFSSLRKQKDTIVEESPTDLTIQRTLEDMQVGISAEYSTVVKLTTIGESIVWQFNLPEGGLVTIPTNDISDEESFSSYQAALRWTDLDKLEIFVQKRYFQFLSSQNS